MSAIFSMETVFDFEKKCLERSEQIQSWIDEKLRVTTPANRIRVRLLVFHKQMVKSFVDNSRFVLESLQKSDDSEPLAHILRTLIELLCRAMYLSKVGEEEKLKKVLGIDLYSIALSGIGGRMSSRLAKECQGLAKSSGIDLPTLEDLKQWIEEGIFELGKSKRLEKFRRDFTFPSVKRLIRDCLDEAQEPRITKRFLYTYYCLASDQIHGNPYLAQRVPAVDPRYRTLALLVILTLKFMKEMSALTEYPADRVDSLVLSFQKYFCARFLDLWVLSKLSQSQND